MRDDEFEGLIHEKAAALYRPMPWREDTRPYYVLVSELMLQQTQVARVIPKFEAFIATFPDERALARASLADVLRLWQGLGYNRRAKYLHEAAKAIVALGHFPDDATGLLQLPGVGKNTAGAILAYSFNRPVLFVETNIRTVYIHHFFHDRAEVADQLILEKLGTTLDHEHPREFYWALMDYGAWLKQNGVQNTAKSKHYKKQSPLKGSHREMRGMIVRILAERDYTENELQAELGADPRFLRALDRLLAEQLLTRTGNTIHLTRQDS